MKLNSTTLSGMARRRRLAHELEAGATGAIAGAILGAAAGPPGMVAGAVLGGMAGTLTGAVLDSESSRQAAHARALDAEIGVSGGDLGARRPEPPPTRSKRPPPWRGVR
jgi:hypothetical protein